MFAFMRDDSLVKSDLRKKCLTLCPSSFILYKVYFCAYRDFWFFGIRSFDSVFSLLPTQLSAICITELSTADHSVHLPPSFSTIVAAPFENRIKRRSSHETLKHLYQYYGVCLCCLSSAQPTHKCSWSRAGWGHVLLLSAGNVNKGTPEAELLDAEPDFRMMKMLGYDAMTCGKRHHHLF